jgi:hypothetical protein
VVKTEAEILAVKKTIKTGIRIPALTYTKTIRKQKRVLRKLIKANKDIN